MTSKPQAHLVLPTWSDWFTNKWFISARSNESVKIKSLANYMFI